MLTFFIGLGAACYVIWLRTDTGLHDDTHKYTIHTITGPVSFHGKYRRDLETDSWHYYEKKNGTIIHFRKEYMVFVNGDTAESINAAKEE